MRWLLIYCSFVMDLNSELLTYNNWKINFLCSHVIFITILNQLHTVNRSQSWSKFRLKSDRKSYSERRKHSRMGRDANGVVLLGDFAQSKLSQNPAEYNRLDYRGIITSQHLVIGQGR